MLSLILGTLALFFSLSRQQVPTVNSPQSPAPAAAPAQTFRISGVVVDALSGRPLAQAEVSIAANSPDAVRMTRSAADGSFAIENVASGKYVLTGRRRGYIAQTYQHETFTTAIVAGPGLQTQNIRFTLAPAASISGQVSDEMSDPVRNAQVLLFVQNTVRGRRATRLPRRASTDDQGRYHFGHVAPGTYFLAVSAHPWYAMNSPVRRVQSKADFDRGQVTHEVGIELVDEREPLLDVVYPVTFFNNALDLAGAAPITLRSGDAQTADFILTPIPALHLLVKTPVNDETQNSYVQVAQSLTENMQEFVRTNYENVAPGLVEVSGLPPGHFKLQITTSKGNESVVRSQAVEISGDTQVDATAARTSPTLSGAIKVDDDSPLTQPANVQLRNTATGEVTTVRSELSGEFSFKQSQVAPGTYELIVFAQAGTVVRSLTATGAKVTGHNLQLTGRQDARVNIVVTKASGRITGYALKDGKGAGGAMVILVPQDPENNEGVFRRDQSDSDGSFTLTAIPPGTFTVLAIENGWDLEWTSPSVLQKYFPDGEIVQVGLGAKLDLKVRVQ